MLITFDIETLPTNDAAVIADMEKTISASGQYKKQESIDEWLKENKASALKELVSKTSFDGLMGRIACIAFSIDDEAIFATDVHHTEREAIELFYSFITIECHDNVVFCGHNLAGFDLPFLKHRSIILGIKPPKQIRDAMSAKPWDSCIADTMNLWDSKKMVSLSKICKALGIKDDDDMDGSKVNDMWYKNPSRVIEYCKNDVLLTKNVYNRIMFL